MLSLLCCNGSDALVASSFIIAGVIVTLAVLWAVKEDSRRQW